MRSILFSLLSVCFLGLGACNSKSVSAPTNQSSGSGDEEVCVENCSSTNTKTETIVKTFEQAPTDILFVLDESCSMSAIANAMRDGFATIAQANYPKDTQMGVTYMSTAWVNEDQSIDYGKVWHQNMSVHQPGYLRLVNKDGVADYLSAFPEKTSRFSRPACDDGWFDPDSKNANGDSCLSAAVQLGGACTVTEAGLVSLEQLLSYKTSQNQRLFREGAFVNIIFVSDTHEPGANYFGKPGAPDSMKSDPESLISMIHANSRGVASVKFGGILPLPKKGHPSLDGLKVIGDIPKTDEEAKVGNEGTWDYSYLPVIKSFDGAVAHAKSDNWGGVAASLIDDSKYTGSVFLELSNKVKKIKEVRVNGKALARRQFFLGLDRASLNLRYSAKADEKLTIEVDYE